MMDLGLISKIDFKPNPCKICVRSKFSRKAFKIVERCSKLLGLIHIDICELNNIITRGGKKYFITFIHDFSTFSYIYLLKNKFEALEKFNFFRIEVENQLGKKVKTLRSDRGGKYLSNEFVETCKTLGIIHKVTTPYSRQQNGVAE